MPVTDLAEEYARQGFLCPLPAIGAARARALCSTLEDFERHAGDTLGALPGQLRAKTHLLFPWLAQLVREEAVLDPVQALIGPDILVYHVTCWLKEPDDGSFVSWHQDGTYFYLDPPEHVTAWIALTRSNPASGCVEVMPGSHLQGQREHHAQPDRANLLSNGQTLEEDVDPAQAVPLVLEPGEMSLHHTYLVHRSGANHSGERRIGIGISYIPTRVRYRGRSRVSASLVRGTDRYGHFDPEPVPSVDMDPGTRSFHADACAHFFGSHGSARTATLR